MPTFAAVDIGSNSVRLKIARLARHRLTVIHEDREVTRLGESVFTSGQLSPDSMAHTVKVLERFYKAAQKKGANTIRVVATSALRDASNGKAFIDWVRSSTGWKVETISGIEEARLIHLGLLANTRLGTSPVLMMDLGGGSCELTISASGHISYTVSLPLGAVRLTEEFLKHDPPQKDELERLHVFISRELNRAVNRIITFKPRAVFATSGTAVALAVVCSTYVKSDRQKTASVTGHSAVRKMASKLAKLSVAERAKLNGIGPRRAEIIVAGAAVYAELLQRCGLAGFRYSPLGLRDGLLAQMASDYDAATKSRRQIESERRDALLACGKQYRVDQNYSQQVSDSVLQLFDQLKPAHGLPAVYADWLASAAMLHEVGAYVNRYGWHRHTHYLITHSEILGYTAYERYMIAAMARYLGKSRPSVRDKAVKLLTIPDRHYVAKATVLLRLARALNQSRRGVVKDLKVRLTGGKAVLRLRTHRRAKADLELWALEKERAYFREVFGRELVPEES